MAQEKLSEAFEALGIQGINEETLPLLDEVIEDTRDEGSIPIDIAQQRAMATVQSLQSLYMALSESETNEILAQSREMVGGFLQKIGQMPTEI